MQEPRVTKEQAIKLKAAGFDWETERYHSEIENQEYTASLLEIMSDAYAADIQDLKDELKLIRIPTLSRVCDWLRDVKGWHVTACPENDFIKWAFLALKKDADDAIGGKTDFTTHDLALSAGIDEVLNRLEKEVGNG